jgi:uncharacterized membrane protein SpoIIM required for sporulation
MLEMLINPVKAERRSWEMFFVGMFYASISLFLVKWVFSGDAVLSRYSGLLVVIFMVMFSMPFVYYTIKLEERKISDTKGTFNLLREHSHAIWVFLWLFIGFLVALSFWYIVLPSSAETFRAQIETYCTINRPTEFNNCIKQYGLKGSDTFIVGYVTGPERLFLIFTNNMYVLLFSLAFSLIMGAGVIFILAWNASVIAAAIGIFTKSQLSDFGLGLCRYLPHGIPEIGSYFIVALAGGLISVAAIKHEWGTERFWETLQDSLNLIILAVVILFISALLEVYITPDITNLCQSVS